MNVGSWRRPSWLKCPAISCQLILLHNCSQSICLPTYIQNYVVIIKSRQICYIQYTQSPHYIIPKHKCQHTLHTYIGQTVLMRSQEAFEEYKSNTVNWWISLQICWETCQNSLSVSASASQDQRPQEMASCRNTVCRGQQRKECVSDYIRTTQIRGAYPHSCILCVHAEVLSLTS